MLRECFLALWPRLVLCLALAPRVHASLQHCHPFSVETQETVDFSKLSGAWYLIGRDDIGTVEELTDAQVNITAYQWNTKYADSLDLPYWFTAPYGCCMLDMQYIGRGANGNCMGKIYRWGLGLNTIPGLLKHKLMSMASYSLLYILWTDYSEFLVLGHCRSEVDYSSYKLYCTHVNVLLLSRTKTQLSSFNVMAVVQARLQAGCTGDLQFSPVTASNAECSFSSVSYKEPSIYEINSI